MIKTNDYDALVYDLESQVITLRMIRDQLSFLPTIVENQETHIEAQEEIERLKYFARQYCTHDEFDELDKLRKEHSLLKEFRLENRSYWFKRGFWNGYGEKNLASPFGPCNPHSHDWEEYELGYLYGCIRQKNEKS